MNVVPQQGASAPVGAAPAKIIKRRKRYGPKAKKACDECRKAHTQCGNERPCTRCKSRGTACVDGSNQKNFNAQIPSSSLQPTPVNNYQQIGNNLALANSQPNYSPSPQLLQQPAATNFNSPLEKHLLDIVYNNYCSHVSPMTTPVPHAPPPVQQIPHHLPQLLVQPHHSSVAFSPVTTTATPASSSASSTTATTTTTASPFLPLEFEASSSSSQLLDLSDAAHLESSSPSPSSPSSPRSPGAVIDMLQNQVKKLKKELTMLKNIVLGKDNILPPSQILEMEREVMAESNAIITFWDRKSTTLLHCNDKFLKIGAAFMGFSMQVGKTHLCELCDAFKVPEVRIALKQLIHRLAQSQTAGKDPELSRYHDKAISHNMLGIVTMNELTVTVKKDYFCLQIQSSGLPFRGGMPSSRSNPYGPLEAGAENHCPVLYHEFQINNDEVQKEYKSLKRWQRFRNVLNYLDTKKTLDSFQIIDPTAAAAAGETREISN